jgi:hypothetical protein
MCDRSMYNICDMCDIYKMCDILHCTVYDMYVSLCVRLVTCVIYKFLDQSITTQLLKMGFLSRLSHSSLEAISLHSWLDMFLMDPFP